MTDFYKGKTDLQVAAEQLGFLDVEQMFEQTDIQKNELLMRMAKKFGDTIKRSERLRNRNTELAEELHRKTKKCSCCCCGGCCK